MEAVEQERLIRICRRARTGRRCERPRALMLATAVGCLLAKSPKGGKESGRERVECVC